MSIHDPANPSQSIAVPSHVQHGAQVGFVSALACQVIPEPLHMEAIDCYIATPSPPSLTNSFLSDHGDNAVDVLAYKKVAKKVHLVTTSLSKDFRIIQCCLEDPLLTLPILPMHPPTFMPDTHLTQEHYDALDLNMYSMGFCGLKKPSSQCTFSKSTR